MFVTRSSLGFAAVDSIRRRAALERFDDLQHEWATVAALPVAAASVAFSVWDHFAPWSRVLWGLVVLMLVASVALHGLWRLRLKLVPIAAILLLICSGLVLLTAPWTLYLSWTVFGPFVGIDSAVPATVSLAVFLVPLFVASYLMLWRIDPRSQRQPLETSAEV